MGKVPSWSALRAAVWATYTLFLVRWRLRDREVSGVTVPRAPDLRGDTFYGPRAVLRVLRATCLERSLIQQRWLADHGHRVDLVIGVSPPSKGFTAHAWLDPGDDPTARGYTEIERLPAPVNGDVVGQR